MERHVRIEAANNRRAHFGLGDLHELESLMIDTGFRDVSGQTLTETVRFPFPAAFVAAQLTATPLSALGALSGTAREAVVDDVRAALKEYERDGALAMPMEADIALARA